MNRYKVYLIRSSEHLYFSLTALYLLLVVFHFNNESTDFIYWYMPFFSTVYIKTYAMLNRLFTRILAKTCILMSFCLYLFIHAQKKSGGELNLVFTQSWRGCLCARSSYVCARLRGNLLTQRATVTPTIPSVLYARLVTSRSLYIESWYVRLNENARVGGNA